MRRTIARVAVIFSAAALVLTAGVVGTASATSPGKQVGPVQFGTDRADVLVGGDGTDILLAGNGNDELRGRGGVDVLLGGNGNDLIVGGAGADTLLGEAGDDTIRAADGTRDTVDCGPGRDTARVDVLDVVVGCETVKRVAAED